MYKLLNFFKKLNPKRTYCADNNIDTDITTDTIEYLTVKVNFGLNTMTFQARTSLELHEKVKIAILSKIKPTYTMTREEIYDRHYISLWFGTKPLSKSKNIDLHEYNIKNNDIIYFREERLLGGSKEILTIKDICLPPYEVVSECEKQILEIRNKRSKTGLRIYKPAKTGLREYVMVKKMNWKDITPPDIDDDELWDAFKQGKFASLYALQSEDDSEAYNRGMNKIIQLWTMYINRNQSSITQWFKENQLAAGIENMLQLLVWYRKCENFNDYYMLTRLAYKLITGKHLLTDVFEHFFPPENNLQADFAENIAFIRGVFDKTSSAISSPIIDKITKMYAFLVTQGFLKCMNMEITEKEFTLLEKTFVKKEYNSQCGMIMHAIDLAIFLCEKLCIYRQTGEISTFLHNSNSYTEWLAKADKLLALAPFTSNLGAHGTTYFSFLSDLNDLIEQGIAISKYSQKNNGTECILIKRKLMNLQLIKNTEVTRKAAQKERRSPFGVLVHGTSSVAKSSFTKMLFYYYGSLFNLDKDDHYRYVRNPAEEYWNNFDSSKWCIQMDDIAFLLPSATGDVDPTLKELLNVVNNVPYVPPQAALEDKGKTPVMARLVVATSNAADLNAHEYFHCPLAVRRRLPFVVHVEPKPEYLHENGKFINPASLPSEHEGYPDFWTITVQKLKPVTQGNRDWAVLETVMIYDNVAEFLKHYGRAAREHETNQDKSMTCDFYMKEISVCPCCMNVSTMCECMLQSETTNAEAFLDWLVYWMVTFILWLYSFEFIKTLCTPLLKQRVVRYATIKICLPFLTREQQVKMMGYFNTMQFNTLKKNTLMMLSLVGFALSGFLLSRSFFKKEKPVKLEPQGNIYGTTETQLAKEESQNVWYTPTIELTNFDMPVASTSLAGKSVYELRDAFQKNCVRLDIKALDSGRSCRTGGVMLVGQICLFNNHVLKEDREFEITVIQTNPIVGLTSNITFKINCDDMKHDKTRDLSVMLIRSLPPFKDITRFWVESEITVSRLCMLKRENDATMRVLDVHGVVKQNDFPIEALNIKVDLLMGMAQTPTQPGDCGSLAIAMTPRGPVMCGLHTVGYNNTLGVPFVVKSILDVMITALTPKSFIVQGCGAPVLGLQNEIQLVQPHHKSLIRYLEKGNVNVYGSFPGFRPKPRSRVCPTPLVETMCNYFKTEIKHGKPAMSGWEPWRKNIIEMVKPTVKHDRSILDKCVKAYAKDIVSSLEPGWEKELLFLSRKASVNGLPGVKFVDKMNTNTSMGFPWNKTKKAFLIPAVDEMYPEGVDFEPDVWERVDAILDKYSKGERAFPVFTGHLKDEATPLKKCEIKKTRLFTGGPVDWSIAVRSRLLTFVRLVQKNQYIFEAGPGLVAQSTEWQKVREFLTAFGEDQIIAGDYGKFDKNMIADFVLAAFEVICTIFEAAGFEENEVREIFCIGNDVAFPLVNVNGDLMEFFGTNPSGHPLTVIINSLVNSLYIRYAFSKLGGDVELFQKLVHLFTYGDDNAMGVSKTIPWFNHTAIQGVLADIGVVYTMADKEAESRPYITINECSFLKRVWRYDEDVGAYLAPLDEESIHRSLTMWVPSGTINEYEQMIAVIVSANNEYFFYGKEIFNKNREFFREILSRTPYNAYVTDSTLPTWQDLYERFWRASGQPVPT
jgi:hypothetical protein